MLKNCSLILFFFLLLLKSDYIYAQLFATEKTIDTTTYGLISQFWGDVAISKSGVLGIAWVDKTEENTFLIFAKSTDHGETFTRTVVDSSFLVLGDEIEFTEILFDYQDNIWIAYQFYSYMWGNGQLNVCKSTDMGNTFSEPQLIGGFIGIFNNPLCADSLGNIYIMWRFWDLKCTKIIAGNLNNIYTTNIYPVSIRPGFYSSIAADKDGGNVYCFIQKLEDPDSNQIYYARLWLAKSTDGGITFTDFIMVDSVGNDTSGQTKPNAIIDSRTNVIYLTWGDSRTGKSNIHFAKSTDEGNSFTGHKAITNNHLKHIYHSSIYSSASRIFITWNTAGSDGIYEDIFFANSTDDGQTFSPEIQVGDPFFANHYQFLLGIVADDSGYVFILYADRRLGYYATRIYLSKEKFLLVNINENPSSEILQSKLFSNYPNPFNPITIINYQIQKAGLVTIKVYDQLGKEITTLVNENKPVGRYSIQFDGSDLASGVYVYQLRTGDFVSSNKMLLLK